VNGVIDAKDAIYSQLLLWIDENFYGEATSIRNAGTRR